VAEKEEFDSLDESTAPVADPRFAPDAVDGQATSLSGSAAEDLSASSPVGASGRTADHLGDDFSDDGDDDLIEHGSPDDSLGANDANQGGEPVDDESDDDDDSDGDDGSDGDDDVEGDKELVTVGAPAKERKSGATSKRAGASGSRLKKEKATPKQKQTAEKERRTGPVKFVQESVGELRKVVYPTGQQLINYFVVVLIFVLFIIAFVSLLDLGFGAAIIRIFS
jgi:preprotein translocase subunit SecE